MQGVCLIDYAKAFHYMNWKKRYKVLREMSVLSQIVDLVESLYKFNFMVGAVIQHLW